MRAAWLLLGSSAAYAASYQTYDANVRKATRGSQAGPDPVTAYEGYLKRREQRATDPDYYAPVWPLPATYVPTGNLVLDPANFNIAYDASNKFLANAAERYLPLILYHPHGVSPAPGTPVLKTLVLNVTNSSVVQIQLGTDESYSLSFSSDQTTATIAAPNVFGALRGLETFSQQVTADKWSGAYSVAAATVVDAPRYPFRGLLVDAARHWLPPSLLLTIMDGLMYTKMNTLKIVLGCDWSWTVQSQRWPNLTLASYYSTHQDHMYNISVMKQLVAEANYRGVRLLPFFETLGHSSAIGQTYPELTWCNGKQGSGLPHPFMNATWDFFDSLWAEYRGVFADEQMNVGGDEIDVTCWQSDPVIEAWMKSNNVTDMNYVISYYYMRMGQSLVKAGFSPIFWADAWGILNATGADLTSLNATHGVTFDDWDTGSPQSSAPVLTSPGAKVIVSSYCYLVPITIPGTFNVPNGATWETNYLCDLANITGVPAQAIADNMIGGHASRWGEMTDGTNIFQFSWPAILGAAEKLWSPANLTDPYAPGYGDRQYEIATSYRCVMVRRGIPMSPMTYAWSCDFEIPVPYPFIPPSTSWWPASTMPTSQGLLAPSSGSEDVAALQSENAALRARVAELEARLARSQAA